MVTVLSVCKDIKSEGVIIKVGQGENRTLTFTQVTKSPIESNLPSPKGDTNKGMRNSCRIQKHIRISM